MGAIIDPRQLPLIESRTIPIAEIEADGIVEQVEILGMHFQTTFFRIVQPFGAFEPTRAIVARVRRPIVSYVPNQLNGALLRAQEKLAALAFRACN